jgi:hypothetical protein
MPHELSKLGFRAFHPLQVFGNTCQSLFEVPFWNGNDQIFFGLEVLEDRSLMYPGIIGNISDSRIVKPPGGKDTLRGFYDKLTFLIR